MPKRWTKRSENSNWAEFGRGIPLGELMYFSQLAMHLRQATLTAPPLRLTGVIGSPVGTV